MIQIPEKAAEYILSILSKEITAKRYEYLAQLAAQSKIKKGTIRDIRIAMRCSEIISLELQKKQFDRKNNT